MDNARAMRRAKRLQHLPGNIESALLGRRLFEVIAESLAFNQLRH